MNQRWRAVLSGRNVWLPGHRGSDTREKTMAQICREYAVADDLVCHWKQVFLERAPEVFRVKQQRSEEQERIAELDRLVGQQALELAASKKVSKLLDSRGRNGARS